MYGEGPASSLVAFLVCMCLFVFWGGGGCLFDNDFFFPVLGWILFCFILVLCVNALGLVNLLSAAEVLVCPWGDERYFQKQIVQTLNK